MAKPIAKELAKLKKIWSAAEPITGSSIPEDDYVAKIKTMELGTSKAGNIQCVITLCITTGKYKNKEVKMFQGLGTEIGVSFFKGVCSIIGLDCPDDITDLPDAIDAFMEDFDEVLNIHITEKDNMTNVRIKGLSDEIEDVEEDDTDVDEEEEEELDNVLDGVRT